MTVETVVLVAALVCSGVYITYLHSKINRLKQAGQAVGAMLMYTLDALEETQEGEDDA